MNIHIWTVFKYLTWPQEMNRDSSVGLQATQLTGRVCTKGKIGETVWSLGCFNVFVNFKCLTNLLLFITTLVAVWCVLTGTQQFIQTEKGEHSSLMNLTGTVGFIAICATPSNQKQQKKVVWIRPKALFLLQWNIIFHMDAVSEEERAVGVGKMISITSYKSIFLKVCFL